MDSAWVLIRAQNALEHKVVSYKLDFSPAFRAVLRYAKLLYAESKAVLCHYCVRTVRHSQKVAMQGVASFPRLRRELSETVKLRNRQPLL